MAGKYLDKTGVQKLWTKTKEKIASEISTRAPASHTHAISNITNLQSSLDSKLNKASGLNQINLTDSAISFITNSLNIGLSETVKTISMGATAGNLSSSLRIEPSGVFVDNSKVLTAEKKGVSNGVASLGSDGKVPSSQLPSYVDDVLEYTNRTSFPATGESGKIYVAKDTNKTYRWSGSAYVEISASLALGETASTAYAGSKGKANADAIATLQSSKANLSDVYTQNQINNKLNSYLPKIKDIVDASIDNGNFLLSGEWLSSDNFTGAVFGGSASDDVNDYNFGGVIISKMFPALGISLNGVFTGIQVAGDEDGKLYKTRTSFESTGSSATMSNHEILDDSMAISDSELNSILV